jgi:hypothetical protein
LWASFVSSVWHFPNMFSCGITFPSSVFLTSKKGPYFDTTFIFLRCKFALAAFCLHPFIMSLERVDTALIV